MHNRPVVSVPPHVEGSAAGARSPESSPQGLLRGRRTDAVQGPHDSQDRFPQPVEGSLRHRRDMYDRSILQSDVLSELLLELFQQRGITDHLREIDLGDGDDNWQPQGLHDPNTFLRLLADSLVGGDDEDCEVSDSRSAVAHAVEDVLARRVDEGAEDRVGQRHAPRPNHLGDAVGLLGGDMAASKSVEESGLAVVEVPHQHDGGDALPAAQARLHRIHLHLAAVPSRQSRGHDIGYDHICGRLEPEPPVLDLAVQAPAMSLADLLDNFG